MGFFAILSSTMSKSPVLKPFSLSLRTPADWTGGVASASTIPGILISLLAASLSDIFGRKKFLLIASFVFASALFLYLFITVWWQLILIRFYHGFATAIFMPVTEALISVLFPTKRGERISLFHSATYVGKVIAPTLGSYILFATADNFHTLYLSVAVASVTALFVSLLFLRDEEKLPTKGQFDAGETVKRLFHGWRIILHNRKGVASQLRSSKPILCLWLRRVLFGWLFARSGWFGQVFYRNNTNKHNCRCNFHKTLHGKNLGQDWKRIPIVLGCTVSAVPMLAVPFTADF